MKNSHKPTKPVFMITRTVRDKTGEYFKKGTIYKEYFCGKKSADGWSFNEWDAIKYVWLGEAVEAFRVNRCNVATTQIERAYR